MLHWTPETLQTSPHFYRQLRYAVNYKHYMPFDYDILIAGAGPAGCAAAYDLARAGKRVLILDRRNFPRPKACACGLTRKTMAALRYSVEPVIERVCREIVLQPADRSETLRIRTRTPICAMAVRERFDAFCLEQTLAVGATFRKIESITALRELPTHIELDIATADVCETLTAPILIGADGSNGQTRQLANSDAEPGWYTRGFALEATIPYAMLPAMLPAGDASHDLVFDFASLPGGYGWLFPKGDHINIGVGAFTPQDSGDAHLKLVTRELLGHYIMQKLGVDMKSLNAKITGQHLGMGGHAYVPRERVLLTGDAAGLVDPLTGEGIHSAIVSGQAVAAAILCGASDVAAAYAQQLKPLQETLEFSHRAARHFYAKPERGFRVMRMPLLRSLVLKTYADGLPHTKLLTVLARLVA
jgi:geranylgeranyl reductase family protein